mmetsp:Transcript_22518/g.51559  ORF Transcript_22518/g.51559 Transcript_22518/m.51559 type:complete len:205 (-) Transcript_22518:202-816(-)
MHVLLFRKGQQLFEIFVALLVETREPEVVQYDGSVRRFPNQAADVVVVQVEPLEAHDPDRNLQIRAPPAHRDGRRIVRHSFSLRPEIGVESHAHEPVQQELFEVLHGLLRVARGVVEHHSLEHGGMGGYGLGDVGVIVFVVDGLNDEGARDAARFHRLDETSGGSGVRQSGRGFAARGIGEYFGFFFVGPYVQVTVDNHRISRR